MSTVKKPRGEVQLTVWPFSPDPSESDRTPLEEAVLIKRGEVNTAKNVTFQITSKAGASKVHLPSNTFLSLETDDKAGCLTISVNLTTNITSHVCQGALCYRVDMTQTSREEPSNQISTLSTFSEPFILYPKTVDESINNIAIEAARKWTAMDLEPKADKAKSLKAKTDEAKTD